MAVFCFGIRNFMCCLQHFYHFPLDFDLATLIAWSAGPAEASSGTLKAPPIFVFLTPRLWKLLLQLDHNKLV